MVSSRTRSARIIHALFREAPHLQSTILTVGRAEAARWGSARRVITVASGAETIGAAWYMNEVWHIGRISLSHGHARMSPTRVVASDHDVVEALVRTVERRAESSPVAKDPAAAAEPRVLAGHFA